MPARKKLSIVGAKRELARLNKILSKRDSEIAELLSQNSELRALVHEDEEQFFATRNGRKFHKRSCVWIKDLPDRILVPFSSHEEACEDYRPCGTRRA